MIGESLNIELFQLLVNSGLMVLIWIVQLVIYPGFIHYPEPEIKKWHPIYARRITYIVMPLMLSQLVMYTYSIFQEYSLVNMSILVLILFNWVITFLMAVPLHGRIDKDLTSLHHRKKLIKVNWPRTIAWTIILIISVLGYGT